MFRKLLTEYGKSSEISCLVYNETNSVLKHQTKEREVAMAELKIRPLGDRVVVKASESVEKTKGGIIIPDTAKEKPQEGKIVAIGKGRTDDNGKLVPMEVKKGDTILYGKYSGSEITLENKEYIIMKEEDILAIVEK